jgi:hypothetical protein
LSYKCVCRARTTPALVRPGRGDNFRKSGILQLHHIQPFCTTMHWEGFEPSTSGFVDRSSVQLSYQCVIDFTPHVTQASSPCWRDTSNVDSPIQILFKRYAVLHGLEARVTGKAFMRRGDLDSPTSRLSAGCSASELTARYFFPGDAITHRFITSSAAATCANAQQ